MIPFKRYLRRIFLDNFFLKIGSFILAVVLWLFVQNQGKIEQKVSYKVGLSVIENLPKDGTIRLFYKSAEMITVKMRGLPSVMPRVEKGTNFNISLPEKYSNFGKEIVLDLKNNNIKNVPLGVEIISIEPSSITIMLDYFEQKMVEIQKNYTGLPQEGYEITKVNVIPSKVNLSGPKHILKDITNVKTETIDINHANRDYGAGNVALLINSNYVSALPHFVKMFFQIQEIIEKKEFNNLIIEDVKKLEGTTFRVKTKDISKLIIQGPSNILKTLSQNQFKVFIDLRTLPANKWKKVKPLIEFPPKFKGKLNVLKIEPSQIKVLVKKIK